MAKSTKSSAKYVDGFLLPVQTSKLKEYKKISDKARKIYMKHGALSYIESMGDDMKIEGMTGFGDYVKHKKMKHWFSRSSRTNPKPTGTGSTK